MKTFHKCQALSRDAALCNRKTNYAEGYHGDGEIYSYSSGRPSWVLVWLCEEHKHDKLMRSFKPKSKRAAQAESKGERDV